MRRPLALPLRGLAALLVLATTPRARADGAPPPPPAPPGAHVVHAARASIHVDVGADAGLAVGMTWQVELGGATRTVTVEAVARKSARLRLSDGAPPARGTTLSMPPGLTSAPAPTTRRPAPAPVGPWPAGNAATALVAIRAAASADQPARRDELAGTRVRGEVSVSMLASGDLEGASTGWHDLALASQLQATSGSWRYDYLLETRLAGAPEFFLSPLQHARAMLNIYLLRLQWTSPSGRLVAGLGRQPAAPIGELGLVDGARARFELGRGLDLSGFAGMRPATDLGLTAAPRVGADLGWSLAGPVRARADVAMALDTWGGELDRAASAASLVLATPRLVVSGDALVDLAADAAGDGGVRLSHAIARVRTRGGRVRLAASGGYDQPYLSRAYVDAAFVDALGDRVFGDVAANLAVGTQYDLGASARVATGDGFTSGYADVTFTRLAPAGGVRIAAAPHVVLGDLVDSFGLRGDVAWPIRAWRLAAAGSFDRVLADGGEGWLGVGRITTSRPLTDRLRMSLALEGAGGAGPARALLFAQLAYRLGR